MMILQDKFPRDIALEIVRAKLNMRKEWNLEKLMKLLYEIIQARECVGTSFSSRYVRKDELKTADTTRGREVARIQTSYQVAESAIGRIKIRRPCIFCKGEHFNSECKRYGTLEQRKRRAYELGLCIKCLRSNHRFKNCTITKKCCYCQKDHNSAFCDRFGNVVNW
ncbi:unnamed protein product, partial [Enterobius vermicularis]|uniref:Nucleic-acid-binding protein from transposon X-element n=1 Tax=Enterobius vermicularis TaxID=51028 RepID=A0A0N4VQB4_ENTVE